MLQIPCLKKAAASLVQTGDLSGDESFLLPSVCGRISRYTQWMDDGLSVMSHLSMTGGQNILFFPQQNITILKMWTQYWLIAQKLPTGNLIQATANARQPLSLCRPLSSFRKHISFWLFTAGMFPNMNTTFNIAQIMHILQKSVQYIFVQYCLCHWVVDSNRNLLTELEYMHALSFLIIIWKTQILQMYFDVDVPKLTRCYRSLDVVFSSQCRKKWYPYGWFSTFLSSHKIQHQNSSGPFTEQVGSRLEWKSWPYTTCPALNSRQSSRIAGEHSRVLKSQMFRLTISGGETKLKGEWILFLSWSVGQKHNSKWMQMLLHSCWMCKWWLANTLAISTSQLNAVFTQVYVRPHTAALPSWVTVCCGELKPRRCREHAKPTWASWSIWQLLTFTGKFFI